MQKYENVHAELTISNIPYQWMITQKTNNNNINNINDSSLTDRKNASIVVVP